LEKWVCLNNWRWFDLRFCINLGDFWKKVSLMVGSAHPTAATVARLKLGSSFLEISLGHLHRLGDGLTGFPGAIETVFPQTPVQWCIVHLVAIEFEGRFPL
jgi:hypothetical protein